MRREAEVIHRVLSASEFYSTTSFIHAHGLVLELVAALEDEGLLRRPEEHA